MYVQMTFEDIHNATSSPALEDGASRLNSPDGRKIGPYGPEAVHVSRTAPSANNVETPMNETSGRCSSGSYRSADLNLSLVNKLKMRFVMAGSIEYMQTWKAKATPSGRRYWVHTASERRTAGTGSTGEVSAWPTASARDWKDTPGMKKTGTNPDGTGRKRLDQLPRMAYQVFLPGETADSSSVGMERLAGYRLNPFFSAWMMGFPQAWTEAGLLAFRKLEGSRSRRRKKVA